MRKVLLIALSIIILSFVIGIMLYGYLPEKIASHWNSSGEVNGYMNKPLGVFLVPIISLAIFLLFIIIPRIDPLKKNIEGFRKYFDILLIVIILFLFYIYILTLIWNLGIVFNMTAGIIPAVGLLFIYIGFILKHIKRNWFIGIRTPWTISSDNVWNKTHKFGSVLFIISGIIILLGMFFINHLIWFILIPIILSSIILMIYSYLEYKKENKNK